MNSENKSKWLPIAISCGITFTVLYFLVNFPTISGFFADIIDILSPILIGAVIAYILNPILKLFEYRIFRKLKNNGAKRTLSIFMSYVTLIAILAIFLGLVLPQLIESVMELVSKLDGYIASATALVNSLIDKFFGESNIDKHIDKSTVISYVANFFSASNDLVQTILDYISEFGVGLFVGVKNLVLGLFISAYMLSAKEKLHAQVRRLTAAIFKDNTRNHVLRYSRVANRTFGNFFLGTLLDATILAIITFIVLLIFGIPYPILVAFIVGVTNIIPFFGPFIGAIPSAFIIFVVSPEKCLLFIIIITILQQIEGNIIAPKVLGNSTGISSLGVLVAIIVMGGYFGIIGMIVGVPIFAMIVTVCNELIQTRLKKKGLPTETGDYYPAYSLVDPHEHHEKLFNRIAHYVTSFFKKIFKRSKKEDDDKK